MISTQKSPVSDSKVEQDLINGTNVSGVNPSLRHVLPDIGIPLVIQDRTFVDANTIGVTDPTWLDSLQTTFGTTPGAAHTGDLWYPHIYVPAQNPWDISGADPFGRWMYGPWFYPPTANLEHGVVPNPYCLPTTATTATDPNYDCSNTPWEPPVMPGTPNPSMGTGATEIGVVRTNLAEDKGKFFLDSSVNGQWDGCTTDTCYEFGLPTDIPVSGNWDGTGGTKIGVFRASNHTFYLDLNGNGTWDGCATDGCYSLGMSTDLPVAGDWDGNGTETIGVYRPSTGQFFVKNTNSSGPPSATLNFGITNGVPVTGK